MITRGRERHVATSDRRGDLVGLVEYHGLLRSQREPMTLEPPLERHERRDGLRPAGREDPHVVDPPEVPNAGRLKCLVGRGEDRVGQDGGWVRPDGKPSDARRIQLFEHGCHVPDIIHGASQPTKGLPNQVRADRRVAPADVDGDEGPGGEGQPSSRPEEGVPCRSPRSEGQAARRWAEDRAIGHHLRPEACFDRRRDGGDERRVPRVGGAIQTREPPNATTPPRRADESRPRVECSVQRHLSPPGGRGEVRPHRCGTVCTRRWTGTAMGRLGIFHSPGKRVRMMLSWSTIGISRSSRRSRRTPGRPMRTSGGGLGCPHPPSTNGCARWRRRASSGAIAQ